MVSVLFRCSTELKKLDLMRLQVADKITILYTRRIRTFSENFFILYKLKKSVHNFLALQLLTYDLQDRVVVVLGINV